MTEVSIRKTHDIKKQIDKLPTTVGSFEVNRLETNNSRRNMIRLPYLCIKAENKQTMNTIMSLERIRYVKPEWQDVRKPKYTQCFNCYKLGHTRTGGCTNPRGCKACLEEGTNHVCTVKMLPEQDEEGNPQNKYANFTCRLCNQKGHPPTWAGCEYIQEKMKAIEANAASKSQRMAEARNFLPAAVPPNNIWAERELVFNEWNVAPLGLANRKGKEAECGGDSFIEDEIKRLLGMSAAQLQKLAEEFTKQYKRLTDDDEKRAALANYYCKVNSCRA